MPRSVNGIGTKFYGRADEWADGTYITTKWFIFFYLPIIPLRSYRVKRIDEGGFFANRLYQTQEVPRNGPQIRKTYAVGAAMVVVVGLAFYELVKLS